MAEVCPEDCGFTRTTAASGVQGQKQKGQLGGYISRIHGRGDDVVKGFRCWTCFEGKAR